MFFGFLLVSIDTHRLFYWNLIVMMDNLAQQIFEFITEFEEGVTQADVKASFPDISGNQLAHILGELHKNGEIRNIRGRWVFDDRESAEI